MIRIRVPNRGEVDGLLTSAEYEDFLKTETE